MLVEFLGWPGSGKSTLARALRTVLAESRPIRNWTRKLNAGFAAIQQPDTDTALLIEDICLRFARAPIVVARRSALLRGDRRLAVAAQKDPRISIADELFLHAVFGTAGPLVIVPTDLMEAIATLVERTYVPAAVTFVYLRPPIDVWKSRLHSRRAGRSRFGSGGDEQLLKELQRDRLLEDGIVDSLKRAGYQVLESRASGPELSGEASRLTVAIERHFGQ